MIEAQVKARHSETLETYTVWQGWAIQEGQELSTVDSACSKEPSGVWRHYKAGLYKAHGTVRCRSSGNTLVLYQDLQGTLEWWLRPLHMWEEEVPGEGSRFEKMSDSQLGTIKSLYPNFPEKTHRKAHTDFSYTVEEAEEYLRNHPDSKASPILRRLIDLSSRRHWDLVYIGSHFLPSEGSFTNPHLGLPKRVKDLKESHERLLSQVAEVQSLLRDFPDLGVTEE